MSAAVAAMEPWVGLVQIPAPGPVRDVVAPPCEADDPAPSVPADVVLAEVERIQAHARDIADTLRAVAVVLPETADELQRQLAALGRHAARLGTRAAGASS